MKEYLSNKINDLPASATLTMAAKAREMKNEGVDIIGLSLGEPDFNIPEYIKDAAIDAINDNYNSYTPVDGYLDLKQSISNKFKRDNNLNYNTNQIVVSTGAKQSIANAVQALVKPGEEVILLAPFWVSYSAIVLMAEGIPKIIKSDISSDFKVNAEEIEKAISDKTKMIIINSPNNPSGSVFNFEELNKIASILRKYPEIFVLSDEIYEHINYGVKHVSFASIDGMYERTITVNGIAKAFAMTGWRIGYIMSANKEAMAQMTKLQYYITACSNDAMQYAVLAAFENANDYPDEMCAEFKSRRDLICTRLNAMPGVQCHVPEGAFYVFPKVEVPGMSSEEVAIELLKGGVLCSPGSAFGQSGEGHLRFAYTISRDDISRGMDKTEAVLKRLRGE